MTGISEIDISDKNIIYGGVISGIVELYQDEIQDFRQSINDHCDQLDIRTNNCKNLKQSTKNKHRKDIRYVRNKVRNTSDEDIAISIVINLSLQNAELFENIESFQSFRRSFRNKEYAQGLRKKYTFGSITRKLATIEETIVQAEQKDQKQRMREASTRGVQSPQENPPKQQRSPQTFRGIVNKLHANVSRSPEEKIGRMQARVANIANEGMVSDERRNELRSMLNNLDALMENYPDTKKIIDGFKEDINDILLAPQEPNLITPNNVDTSKSSSTPDLSSKEYPANFEAIDYINHLLSVVTHACSSKKINGYKTHGDGNFVTCILRPLLNAIKNEIFAKHILDASCVSWEEIESAYRIHIDDNDSMRNTFLGILKKNTKKGTFFQIITIPFLQAIGDFSDTSLYKDHKGALVNVLELLEKNPPNN